jgi:hypothetical protein
MKDINHNISRYIVDHDIKHSKNINLKDLEGIRNAKSRGKKCYRVLNT